MTDNIKPLSEAATGTKLAEAHSPEGSFLSKEQLLTRLPISRGTLDNWRRAGSIPSVKLSGRRVLFHWPSVEAALLRMQRQP